MPKKAVVLDPLCARCNGLMDWNSTHLVSGAYVNVFDCRQCNKMTAQAEPRKNGVRDNDRRLAL